MPLLFVYVELIMLIVLSFLMGCTFTYLITIISSSIKAAVILEEACDTFALMMLMGFETNKEQSEYLIINNEMNDIDAQKVREKINRSFENQVNKKIMIINNNIPVTHKNIVNFQNFEQLKTYMVDRLRKQNRRR